MKVKAWDEVSEVIEKDQVEECVQGQRDEELSSALVDELRASIVDEGEGSGKDVELSSVEESVKLCESSCESKASECDSLADKLDVPNVLKGSKVNELREEVLEDPSLRTCRSLATKKVRGYYWQEGLIFHRQEVGEFGFKNRLVLPRSKREHVLQLAHDHHSHIGVKKMKPVIAMRFTWPNIHCDIDPSLVSNCNYHPITAFFYIGLEWVILLIIKHKY